MGGWRAAKESLRPRRSCDRLHSWLQPFPPPYSPLLNVPLQFFATRAGLSFPALNPADPVACTGQQSAAQVIWSQEGLGGSVA